MPVEISPEIYLKVKKEWRRKNADGGGRNNDSYIEHASDPGNFFSVPRDLELSKVRRAGPLCDQGRLPWDAAPASPHQDISECRVHSDAAELTSRDQ